MAFELRQLRYLLAVAEHGSLGRAAETLGITQPALTRSLQALEQHVGAPLFERLWSGVVPTDEGRVVLHRARDVVQVADEFDRETRRHRVPGAGHVTIGAGAYAAETLVAAALAPFVTAHPRIRVRVVTRDWDELGRRLRARELDFFVAETSTFAGEHDLDVEPLSPHPVFFVARRGHPLAGRAGIGAAQTFAYPFASLTRHPPRALQPMLAARAHDDARDGRPFPALELNSLAALKRVVATSDAICALSLPCCADELRSGSLVTLGSEPWMSLGYGFVMVKDRPPSPEAVTLREHLRATEAQLTREEGRLLAHYDAAARPAPQPA